MKPDPTHHRIAVFGHFGAGNLGNEATLCAMLHNLRKQLPGAEFTCVCSAPVRAASEYGIAAVPIRAPLPFRQRSNLPAAAAVPAAGTEGAAYTAPKVRRRPAVFAALKVPVRVCSYPLIDAYRWFKAITTLKGTAALVMTGTGMLGDASLHYEIFRWTMAARLRRCKVLFVSVGAGPIRRPLRRWFVKLALNVADYRSYRDSFSKEYLETIGADVKTDPVYPDLAFSLPRDIFPADPPGRSRAVIGVGLMDYYGSGRSTNTQATYRRYVGCVAGFVAAMLQRSYAVRILIGDFAYDQEIRRDLKRALEERRIAFDDNDISDNPALSVGELLLQLSSVDIVVSSRFHNLVLALILKKPVFAISYQEKFAPLIEAVGLSDFYLDIDHIDVDELIDKVIRLRETAPAIGARTAKHMETYRAALDEQYERMRHVILSCH
jgi:polysaccharide pyruvyl transferase WcaK-like protein